MKKIVAVCEICKKEIYIDEIHIEIVNLNQKLCIECFYKKLQSN